MHRLLPIICFFLVIGTLMGCKDRFEPKLSSDQRNYLVVEGSINPDGFSNIILSRTLPLSDANSTKPELNAQVFINGEDNSKYNLRGNGPGKYVSDSLTLNTGQKYRLQIKTTNGGEYMSAYVSITPNPTIDSVNWKIKNDGVQIYTNTHNPQNNTRYYKWEYEETWEMHSTFPFRLIYNPLPFPHVTERKNSEIDPLYFCWRTESSTNILMGSSAHLANDVISLAPMTFIPLNSVKLGVRYSIIVKQYALDRKTYDFYNLVKSNTESLGSVFDPLPSEITGNITCVSNPSEKVIGYIFASKIQQQRIFISRLEVPSTYGNGCETIYVLNNVDSLRAYFGDNRWAPFDSDGPPSLAKGYYASLYPCLDCTLRGTSVKPSFW